MATLKDKLDAFDGQPEQEWNKRKGNLLVSADKCIEQIFRKNTCLPYMP